VNCQFAQNRLSAYLDRELAGDQMMAVRAHIEVCTACQAEMEGLRAVKHGLRELPMVEPRENLAADILRLARAERKQSAPVPFGFMVATSVAAAVLAVLLFNLFFGPRSRPQYADQDTRFDAASDSAVTSPDFGGHAPLIPVGR
jgi:anti-sigma factor RsiW